MLAFKPMIELVYNDASGSTAMLTAWLQADTTVAAADDAIGVLSAALASLTGCTLVRTRIVYKFRADTPAVAEIGSLITQQGVFMYDCTVDGPGFILSVPGLVDDVIITTGVLAGIGIDTSDSRVTDLTDVLIENDCTNAFADTITALATAFVQSRV